MFEHRRLLIAATAGLLAPLASQAQRVAPQVGTGIVYETFRFSDKEALGLKSIALLSVPFGARIGLSSVAELSVAGHYASGTLERTDGSSSTISGLTDTDVLLTVPVIRDFVSISALFIAPTGKSTLSIEELDVAGAIASDLLPFRVSNWGSGGGFGLATTVVRALNDANVGFTVGYRVASEFTPLADEDFAYRPGNELQVKLAADRRVGATGKASLQLGLNHFTADEFDGQNLFRAGNRIQAIASYSFAAGSSSSAVTYGGVLHREHGALLGDFASNGADSPSQTLLLFGAGMRMPGFGGSLLPSADLRLMRRSDGIGQGYVASVGPSIEWVFSGVTLMPVAKVRFGNLTVNEDASTGLLGFEAGAVVRFGGPR